jgi:hypothetical protein
MTASAKERIENLLRGGYRPDEVASIIEGEREQWRLNEFDIEDMADLVKRIKEALDL